MPRHLQHREIPAAGGTTQNFLTTAEDGFLYTAYGISLLYKTLNYVRVGVDTSDGTNNWRGGFFWDTSSLAGKTILSAKWYSYVEGWASYGVDNYFEFKINPSIGTTLTTDDFAALAGGTLVNLITMNAMPNPGWVVLDLLTSWINKTGYTTGSILGYYVDAVFFLNFSSRENPNGFGSYLKIVYQ